MRLHVCQGDLLDQNVEVIVNAWNRNLFPWWVLIPQGVSAAIRRKAGLDPFRELARMKMLPLGGAVETTAGRLPFRSIIHVAGIGLLWRTSEQAISTSVSNALRIAEQKQYHSIAFPLIGAGTGGFSAERSLTVMRQAAEKSSYLGDVYFVAFSKINRSERITIK